MMRAVTVRGRITDDRHIEVDEPLGELSGPVEVTLRPVAAATSEVEDILDFLATLPPGTRTQEEIDRQVRLERDSWKRPWDHDA